jgi:hypothetical protein
LNLPCSLGPQRKLEVKEAQSIIQLDERSKNSSAKERLQAQFNNFVVHMKRQAIAALNALDVTKQGQFCTAVF